MQVLSPCSLSQISGGHISIKEKDNKMLIISLDDHSDFLNYNALTFTTMGVFDEQGFKIGNQGIYGGYRIATPDGYWMDSTFNYLLVPVKG